MFHIHIEPAVFNHNTWKHGIFYMNFIPEVLIQDEVSTLMMHIQ